MKFKLDVCIKSWRIPGRSVAALLMFTGLTLLGQDNTRVITLDSLQRAVRDNLSYNSRYALTDSAYQLDAAGTRRSRHPSVAWNTRATGQSHVIEPLNEAQAMLFPDIPHFQFASELNFEYALYDGGINSATRTANDMAYLADRKEIEVMLNSQQELVNDLYYTVLLKLQEKIILGNSADLIQEKIEVARTGEEFGTVLPGTVLRLEIEQDKLVQKIREVESDATKSLRLLSRMSGLELTSADKFAAVFESVNMSRYADSLVRPELELMDLRKKEILANSEIVRSGNNVKVLLFANGGIGYPNPLNFLEVKLQPYALGGIKLSVPLFDWNQTRRREEELTLMAMDIDIDEEAFLDRIDREKIALEEDAQKIMELIEIDERIIEKESAILQDYSTMLDQGIIKGSDYTEQLDAVTAARLRFGARKLSLAYINTQYLTKLGLFPTKS